jgi:putative glutamine amidotransferase
VLGICRGLQILNVACGGTLHPHLPDVYGDKVTHRLPPRRPTRHPVRIEAGSRTAGIIGLTEVDICSWHHQGVNRLGADLRPVSWAADDVIEGLEHTTHPWCVAVQWHPEMQLDEPEQVRLFRALVDQSMKQR